MAKATNTTKTIPAGDNEVVAETNTARKPKTKVDLTKCLRCGKKITAFVASAEGKFCDDNCLNVYYAD